MLSEDKDTTYIIPCGTNHFHNLPDAVWNYSGMSYLYEPFGCGEPVQITSKEFQDFKAQNLVLVRCDDCCYGGGAAARIYLVGRTHICLVCEKTFSYQCLDRSLSMGGGCPTPHQELCPSCIPPHNDFQRTKILDKTGWKCAYCGCGLTTHSDDYNTEHVVPKSRGGPNIPDNIVSSCKSCNRKKHTKTLPEFRAWIEQQIIPGQESKDWLQNFMSADDWEVAQGYYDQINHLYRELAMALGESVVTFELDHHDINLFRNGHIEQGDNSG